MTLQEQREYNKLLKEARDLAANLQIGPEVEETMANLKNDLEGAERYVTGLKKEWNEFSSDLRNSVDIFKNITDEISQSSSAVGDVNKGFKGLTDTANKLLNSQRGYNKLSSDQIKDLQKKAQLDKAAVLDGVSRLKQEEQSAKAALEKAKRDGASAATIKKLEKEHRKVNAALVEANNLRGKQSIAQNALVKGLNDELDKTQKIEKAMGLAGVATQGISSLLNKTGFGSLAGALKIDEVKEKVEGELVESLKVVNKETGETTYRAATFGEKLGTAGKIVSGLGANIVKNLTDPLALGTFLVTQLVDAFMMVDKTSGDIAKSLGTSIGNARQISDRMNDIALDSNNIFLTTKNLTESYIALNEQFGTAVSLTDEQLESFTKLTKQAGMSVEAATEFSNIAMSLGSNTEDIAQNFIGSAKAAALNNGVILSTKQISESIKDLSAATLLSLEQNPDALGKAVGVAQSLGMEMKQIEGIAKNLLDFESSISAELEAELLTGKQLNLETARLAALNNDVATVAEEISKQVGSAAEFGKMNVLQQEALAKSVGMERDQLAQMLKDREVLTKMNAKDGETAQQAFNRRVKEVGMEQAKKELGDQSLANQMQQASTQEKFAQTMEKVKEAFVGIAEALMPAVEAVASMLTYLAPITNLIGKMMKLIAPLAPIILGVVAAMKTYKFLTNDIYRTTVLTNAAKKIGLITDEQAEIVQKRNQMTGNRILNIKKMKEFFNKNSLRNTIAENAAEDAKNGKLSAAVILEKSRNFFKALSTKEGRQQLILDTKKFAMDKAALVKKKAIALYEGLAKNEKLKSFALSVKDVALEKGKVAIQKGSLAIQYLINGAKRIANILSSKNLLKGAANMLVGVGRFAINAAASVSKIPVIGPILAIAAAAAAVAGGMALYNKFKKADDLMSPGQGMGGYGKRLLLAPEGQFALNNRDTIVAGTNLDRPSTGIAPSQSQAAPVQQAAAPAQSAPQQSEIKNNTSVTVKMDADKLGMASAKSSNRIQ